MTRHQALAGPPDWKQIYDDLERRNPSWRVFLGEPVGPGWIRGMDLRTAASWPFASLLARIGERMATDDRRTIAASFALRYGWSAGIAIGLFISRVAASAVLEAGLTRLFVEADGLPPQT